MDRRFVSGSHLFNCFRVESTALDRRTAEFVELSFFDRDGALLGRTSGVGRLRGAFKLLGEAWQTCTSTRLTRIMPTLNEVLSSLAHSRYHARFLRGQLIDAASGKVNQDITRRLSQTDQIAEEWKLVLRGISDGIIK
jgi:hypothetical protein